MLRRLLSKFALPNNPDFLVIGTQKSGTSTLHYYLDQHPYLKGSVPKELHFFEKMINYPDTNIDWYRNHFKGLPFSRAIYFETTPSYIYYEAAASRISQYYPEIKMVVILRDPIDRAFSAWNMYYDIYNSGKAQATFAKGLKPEEENLVKKYFLDGRTEFPSFREAIEIELDLIREGHDLEPSVLRRGLYFNQLKVYHKYFKADQFLILGFKELVLNPIETCNKVLNFIGVEKPFGDLRLEIQNKRKYDFKLEDGDRNFLDSFYKEENENLFKMLGHTLDW